MLKHLRVRSPITFFDIETTGVDPDRDRIIEIACLRLEPGGETRSLDLRFNPKLPIPPAASAVHGIRDEHVADCPSFDRLAKRVACFFRDSDLGGFGIARFDLPFLVAEFDRAGRNFRVHGRKVIDAMTLFHRLERRDLGAAVRRYCGKEHEQAHRARHDVLASVFVLDAMLGKHREVPRGVNELHDLLIPVDVEGWFRRERDVVLFARGKHRDVPLDEVARRDASYLDWLSGRVLSDARWFIDQAKATA